MKYCRVLFALLAVLFSLFLTGCGGSSDDDNVVPTPSNTYSIVGRVTSSESGLFSDVRAVTVPEPVADAKVFIEEIPGYSTTSDSNGRFELKSIPEGEFHVVATKDMGNSKYGMRSGLIKLNSSVQGSVKELSDDIVVVKGDKTITGSLCYKDKFGNESDIFKSGEIKFWGRLYPITNGRFTIWDVPGVLVEPYYNIFTVNVIIDTKTYVCIVDSSNGQKAYVQNYVETAELEKYKNDFAGGSGTSADPFLIATYNHLKNIATDSYTMSAYYKLINDIDLGDYNWTPICKTGFSGSFDGNDHKILNLMVNKNDQDDVGLFACAKGANFSKVVLENVFVRGRNNVGALLGNWETTSGTICTMINCSVTGEVTGSGNNVGGLVGYSNNGTLEKCIATCFVSGKQVVGGIAGYIKDIKMCGNNEAVSGTIDVGGLTGISIGTISQCYNKASIKGIEYTPEIVTPEEGSEVPEKPLYGVGGIVGRCIAGNVMNCCNEGSVLGSAAGGIVGCAVANANIQHCINYGCVTADANNPCGGIVGMASENASNESIKVLNSVALCDYITGGQIRHRILGQEYEIANIELCYGRADMKASISGSADFKTGFYDGTDLSSSERAPEFWTTTLGFDSAIWDTTTDSPVLRQW